jgi:hypothetical protein
MPFGSGLSALTARASPNPKQLALGTSITDIYITVLATGMKRTLLR